MTLKNAILVALVDFQLPANCNFEGVRKSFLRYLVTGYQAMALSDLSKSSLAALTTEMIRFL